ncbi:MAG: chorismate synthase [Vampirovibrionales bacterium]
MMMKFLTAGESHGPGLTVMIDHFPSGVPLSSEKINHDLRRRQGGYGRGGRQQMEKDAIQFMAGVRFGVSTGAPIALFITNKDHANWQGIMDAEGTPTDEKSFIRPRPGHADLAGYYKYNLTDLRDALERASARETAARVAAGGVAKALLAACGITVFSHVVKLGGVAIPPVAGLDYTQDAEAFIQYVEGNDIRCAGDEATMQTIRQHIDATRKAGSTLGGVVECVAVGCPAGLGSYVQWDRKLDGQLAQAVMSIQAVKAVAIGDGELGGEVDGSQFHDAICLNDTKNIVRPTNRAGGLEGGVTNGMPLVVRAVMKPIATLIKPLTSVNLNTVEEEQAHFERSDVTAVPACAVVTEAMVAITLATALLDKFGADHLGDIQTSMNAYQQRLTPSPVS